MVDRARHANEAMYTHFVRIESLVTSRALCRRATDDRVEGDDEVDAKPIPNILTFLPLRALLKYVRASPDIAIRKSHDGIVI